MASSKLVAPVVSSVLTGALVVATVTYISLTNGNGEKSTAKGTEPTTINTGHGPSPISAVPEANPGLVMIPFFGAVLVFSSLNLLRPKISKKTVL
jgi:hypothetical protein